MAGLAGLDASKEGQADQSQVADEVEGFVATEFVRVAERTVHDPVFGEDDGVIQGAAADKAHGAKRLDIGFEAEGARTRENLSKRFGIHEHFDLLLADERVGKIHVAADTEFVCGIDANAAAVFDNFDRFEDAKVTALATKTAESSLIQELEERLCGTVKDGNLDVIQFDEDVVDAVGVGGGEKVFGGGEQNALLHKAGGVADAGDIVAVSFDGEIVEVNSTENDPAVRGSRLKPELRVDAGVEAHTFGLHRAMDGRLKHWIT
jgi:hypothetical protein